MLALTQRFMALLCVGTQKEHTVYFQLVFCRGKWMLPLSSGWSIIVPMLPPLRSTQVALRTVVIDKGLAPWGFETKVLI